MYNATATDAHSHKKIKGKNKMNEKYIVCYSTEDMADRVNQGKLFFWKIVH